MINKDTYKRLTAKKEDRYWEQEEFWQSAQEPSYEEIEELYSRLAELEDKIMDGTLVELPCKVGDTVYCIYRDDDYEYWIEAEEVVDFIINDCDIDIGTACRMIGKVYREEIFPTKAEAEAKLKELQEGKK